MRFEEIFETKFSELNSQHDRYLKNKDWLDSLASELAKAGADVFLDNTIDVRATGGKDTLVGIIRVLRKFGWETDVKPEENQRAYMAFFKHELTDFRVWFCFSSTICRRVQVGTELKEMPIWEVVCE